MKFLLILVFLTLISCEPPSKSSSIQIQQKPILFNAQRIALTEAYRKTHYGINQSSITIVPQMIVLHWTQIESLSKVFQFFYLPTLSQRPDLIGFSALNVSAHFLVDRDGTIYQLMPSNWMARHVIGLNNVAIGIENVGGFNGQQDLTSAQVSANVALIRYLVKQYPTIHYLIGHYEYLTFRNSKLWQERNPKYFTIKIDPGPIFMQKVRSQVQNLKLKSAP